MQSRPLSPEPSHVLSIALLALLALPGSAQGQLPEHLRPAFALLRSATGGEAVEAFEALVRDDPEDGEAWYGLGLAHHYAGDYHAAIRGHLVATQLIGAGHPFRVNASYNMACAYARLERPERSLRWLHRARDLGFSDRALLARDADLVPLRGDPRFEALQADGSIAAPVADGSPGAVEVVSLTDGLPGNTGGVAVDAAGAVYTADFGDRVFKLLPEGGWEVFSSGYGKAADCTFDDQGHLLQVDHARARVWRIAPDGQRADLGVQGLSAPVGIDTEPGGGFYLTDYRLDAILRVATDGSSAVVARGGLLDGPNGIAWAGAEGLFVVNYNNGAVIRIDPESGEQRLIAELPGDGNGHAAWSGEALYVTGRKAHRIYRVSPLGAIACLAGTGTQASGEPELDDGGGATARFSLPNGIALSADGGALFVNDSLGSAGALVRRLELSAD